MFNVFGAEPMPYHALSIGLHTANAVLVMALARHLTQNDWVAGVASGLFLLYPAQVEAVVWLSCYYELLVTFFYLAVVLCLAKFQAPLTRRREAWYFIALGLFQLGLWSKETIYSLPILIGLWQFARVFATHIGVPVSDKLPQKSTVLAKFAFGLKHPLIRHLLKEAIFLVPFVVLIFVSVIERYRMWGMIGGYPGFALADPARLPPTLYALLVPLNQVIFSPNLLNIVFWVTVLSLLVLIYSGWRSRVLWLVAIWLAISLLPLINVPPITPDLQGSRFLYLPVVGYVIGVAALAHQRIRRWLPRYGQWVFVVVCVCVMALSAVIVRIHLRPWAVASRITQLLPCEVNNVMQFAEPNTLLYAPSLPDNFQGAYLYRIGLDTSLLLNYDKVVNWWVGQANEPDLYVSKGATSDIYQLLFQSDATDQHWSIKNATARLIAEPTAPLPANHFVNTMPLQLNPNHTKMPQNVPTPYAEWRNFCGTQWTMQNATAICDANGNASIKLNAPNATYQLSNTAETIVQGVSNAWSTISVQMLAGCEKCNGARLKLWWRPNSTSEWQGDNSASIAIPAHRQKATYVFFIPPQPTAQMYEVKIEVINHFEPASFFNIQYSNLTQTCSKP
jgi:hypothetical protein